MDQATDSLELGAVKTKLLRRIHTPLGAREVHALLPFPSIEAARGRVEAIRQARVLLDKGEPPPVSGARDVYSALERAEKGLVLEPPSLRAAADTMSVGAALRRHLLGYEGDAPLLYGFAASLVDLSRQANQVRRCFGPDGQLLDDASPELGPLRKRVRSLRESIQDKLSELLRAPSVEPYLQENYFTVRGDRYVLPIQASFKNEVKGIVHDASGSGQTVFIEPQELVDLGNRLKIAQSDEKEEELRILSRLTSLVARDAGAVREIMRVVGLLDLLSGCARLAIDLDCSAIVPDSAPGFNLRNARHPLLLLQAFEAEHAANDPSDEAPVDQESGIRRLSDVVGNDIGLLEGQLGLILSGPNTGGKTVALKTVGLFALMVRCGLHLPCDESSRIGWFRRVEVAIGDRQSIASNLSTFAAHLKELIGIIECADKKTLVLVDEIVSDTDPTQGQALAQAILEHLADRGAFMVVTTHFERLKAVPFADDRFRNAGVGFDPDGLKPTFHVTLDAPQGSSGFDIAQALGLSPVLVNRAKALTGDGATDLDRLIAGLEARSASLERVHQETESVKRALEEEKARWADKRRALNQEMEALKEEAREELLEEIAASRQEVRAIVARLQASKESGSARDAMREANRASVLLQKIEKSESSKQKAPEAPTRLAKVEVGDWVHVASLNADGDVVKIEGKQAYVAVGNMRTRVPVASLSVAIAPRSKKASRPSPKAGTWPQGGASFRASDTEAHELADELDLRGCSVDEAMNRLDAFLDHHYRSPTTRVSVIHGHGTGVLRDAVREQLRSSGYTRAVRPGDTHEGGDGVTVVDLA